MRVTRGRRWRVAGALTIVAGALAGYLVWDRNDRPAPAAGATVGSSLDAEALDVVADTVRAAFAGSTPIPPPGEGILTDDGPVFAVLRDRGRRLTADWGVEATASASMVKAVKTASDELAVDERSRVDVIELSITHSFRRLDIGDEGTDLLASVHRGVRGLELRYGDEVARYAPTHMLATNRDFEDALASFRAAYEIDDDEVGDVAARTFEAEQVLVPIDPSASATRMFRGNRLVAIDELDEATVTRSADLMTAWLFASVQLDGRMTYKYWPSSGDESSANNMIRQWMATVALMRGSGEDSERRAISRRNLEHNLRSFYRLEDDLGVIEYEGEVKLGAVALAALAIVESPDRSEFAAEEAALLRTIDRLWYEDGRFDTFLRPAARRDENQNFYPGETLLLWATLYRERGDPVLLERYMKSFEWYRRWHLDDANRNPAFVPWHTQAHVMVWAETGDPALAELVFEMNDWLLDMQQWDDVTYPDLAGRFYNPDRREFGPPHASSTGVYLEGLIDAWSLAATQRDHERAERYRQAIVRGLRSVMQLQFDDHVDAYYVSQRDRVHGGVRTEVYDNAIRVDNVQHNLMALRKILASFTRREYRP